MRWLLALVALPLVAQDVRVYSEFRRIDSSGELLAPDRGGEPREILSPAVPRNAFTSYRVVVTVPAGSDIWVEIGQNPENFFKLTAYEEFADGRLQQVKLPWRTRLPEGATSAVLWLDSWVPKSAQVERVKLEPQLFYGNRWYTYPIEVRVAEATVPGQTSAVALLAYAADASSDAPARQVLREALCGEKPPSASTASDSVTVWRLIRRNALQDAALAGGSLGDALLRATKTADLRSWCSAPPATGGPEWYLRVRDEIIRRRGAIP